MGALTYYPEKSFSEQTGNLDLDELAEECQKILNTEYSDKLDELYRLGGTSGGTRPKIMTTINGEEWIIKFPAHVRRMCFNVFAHNRDDHSKNFTYLYDDKEDKWHLSPAYDLTYSNTYYGEHTTTVDGNGRDPGRKELLAVGIAAGMKKGSCEKIIDEIQTYVKQMLREYLERCQ